jgi:hypothetical protein
VKLSDDEIEEVFTRSATVVQRYFTRSAVLWAFCHTNRRFKFQKRNQVFIRAHNEPLSVAAMRIGNADRSPFAMASSNASTWNQGT